MRRQKSRVIKQQRNRRIVMKQSKKPRAVFAPSDITIIKKAVGSYIRHCEQYCVAEEEMREALNLYHRLGRISDDM
jgi:hypothetical protein